MSNKSYWLIRIGLAFVFVYFGIDKFFHPLNWVGYVPGWFEAFLPITLKQFIYVNGVVEILLGLGLMYKKTVRWAADIIIVFLVAVIVSQGLDEVIVRDIGLLFMAIAIAIWKR